jgi:chromosomal replication initiation ATPase DnaA
VSRSPQYSLALPPRPALGRGDFVTGAANEAALAWIERWPGWPGPVLALAGPPASGKSHLGAVWQARSGAVAIEGAALSVERAGELLAGARPVLVEHADAAEDRPLLHLYNGIVERRSSLLLIAREPPARWKTGLPDLASRLATVPVATIAAPDDALIAAVLAKLFADRRLPVAEEALAYLVTRMERSLAAASELAAAIDAEALSRKGPVTIPLIRDVLGG